MSAGQGGEPKQQGGLGRPAGLNCSGCGIELEPLAEELIWEDDQPFCSWCWSNDCCRVSREAAGQGGEE
ncbi:hypothetical protein [Desulfogranum mediterraneum]|uniref:hypothetical protein n=1 Tax=Desulfogranum mediterraneum TaxID=160661 RepID=UPI00040D6098|nr:hypothetical protein [Desulfogranum mediterraneum]